MKVLGSPKPRAATIINHAMHAVLRVGTHYLNPFMLSLAGSRRMPMLAIINHRGRHSGRSYTTPLAARPTADGFVIPLTFGEQADWYRNVQAAGGCMVQWKGANYPLIEPKVVDFTTVRRAFYPAERVLIPIIGIEHFVLLRHAPSSGSNPT